VLAYPAERGRFAKNSIGNITAIVTTTLSDVENSAARVLVSVLGGFFNSVALVIVLLVFDWRIGLVATSGVLIYLAVGLSVHRDPAGDADRHPGAEPATVEETWRNCGRRIDR